MRTSSVNPMSIFSAASRSLTDYPQVDMLSPRYKHVNFRAGKSPNRPRA